MARNDRIVRVEALKVALCASRAGVPLKTLAERHGWNLRGLYRDIEALDKAGYIIERNEHRFRIVGNPRTSAGLPDADERLALFLARQQARGWKETSLGKALDRLWHRISASGNGQAALVPVESSPWLTTREMVGIDHSAHRSIIAALERATRTRVAVNARYRALSSGQVSSRIIEPGELYWDPGLETLYLVGWCRLRDDVRVFAVHRFLAATLTNERCGPRPQTRSRSALHKAFRVWRSEHVDKVRIWFAREVAEEIRERKWLPDQQLEEAEGGIVLAGEVAGLAEVERWILGYGPAAKVLAPRKLATTVARKLREAAEKYRGGKAVSWTSSDKGVV
jgi:predicted DNA-binding transcriptional regulator YafY